MLQLDLCGQEYNKAEHSRRLRKSLKERSKPAVEFKHRNVSAVLLKLGLPYIDGYKPAVNYERSVLDAVRTHLEANAGVCKLLEQTVEAVPDTVPKLDAWERLFEAPPNETPMPDQPADPWPNRQGRKIDFVHRDAANRRLGRLGEEFACVLER
jgi:hypothetical protein